jgi:Domain of unknown function (DUF5060)
MIGEGNFVQRPVLIAAGLFISGLFSGQPLWAAEPQVKQTGAAAIYDAVTLSIEGPQMDERTGGNPFADVRLDVTFTQGKQSWTIPGYFAGCKDAADSSCSGGNIWRAHFLPMVAGDYQWKVRFREGKDVVFQEYDGKNLPGNNAKGSFTVSAMQKDPIKARGLIRYTGESYYRYSGDNSIFFKFGPDAPENMLAFEDFDNTTNFKGLRKNWVHHAGDYKPDAKPHLWGKGKKGKNILGMLRYVADQKLNGISALTWNTSGDDRNVFPHLLAVPAADYEKMVAADQWRKGVVQDRFDLSKLAQWERVFSYADKLGLHINMKLQETENDSLMDDGAHGRARKLYLREMVARFGHYLGVTWNLGEENVQRPAEIAHMSYYIDALDAYDRPIVLHSYPPQKERYRAFLGTASAINGLSLQSNLGPARDEMTRWRMESDLAGKPWVLSWDEQGPAKGGTGVDEEYPAAKLPSERKEVVPRGVARREVIWNALLSGANGGEAYYGYQTGCTDLDCQDHRTRANLWKDAAPALDFFRTHVGDKALSMRNFDDLTDRDDKDYVFAEPGRIYVVMKAEKQIAIQMPGISGRFSIDWYDAINGGALQKGSIAELALNEGFNGKSSNPTAPVVIGDPPAGGSGEWIALVRRKADDAIFVEAESFTSQRSDNVRKWYRIDSTTGETPGPDPDDKHLMHASGDAYVELLPDTRTTHGDKMVREENFTEQAGTMAVLSYDIDFPAAGEYYVWTRIFASGTEDNSLHVGINGQWPDSGKRIQFCPGAGQWYWDNRQRTEGQHCGVPGAVRITVPSAGKHRVEFSMREDGVEFDAFYLTRDYYPPAALLKANQAIAPKKKAEAH